MKRLLLILFASLSLALLASHALAAGPAPKDTWTSVRSKNFFLIGNASEKDIRRVAERLEKFREVFGRLFPKTKLNAPVPTTVIVFKSDSYYKPFKPNPNVAGYFLPGEDVNYVTLTAEQQEGEPFRVIFHEYVHLLLNNTLGRTIPLWFNEGLAEYYSSFEMNESKNEVVLGSPISHHVFYLREQKMLPLRTLFTVDHNSPHYNEKAKQGVFYAESWALVHYLLLGNNGQRQQALGRFVNLLAAGTPVETAFQQAFQTSFEAMEKELQSYVQRYSYPTLNAILKDKLVTDEQMQSAVISEAEAQAYLGDLLLHTRKLPEAEARLQQALALDPNVPLAQASLGMLRLHQGRLDEARRYLEKAAAADAQNYLVHYYYAFALSREGMNESHVVMGYGDESAERMRAELKKAIALKPDFPESYHLLAFVNLVRNEQIDESIQMLKNALAISTGKLEYSFILAQLYERKEQFAAARQLLEPIARAGADPEAREHAQLLLDALRNREEQLASFKAAQEKRRTNNAEAAPASDDEDSDGSSPHLLRREGSERGTGKEGLAEAIQNALRKPAQGEEQERALLVRIDCGPKGIVFNLKVGDRTLTLHAPDFNNLVFTTYTTEVKGEISCGPRQPANHVVVTYRPSKDPRTKTDGEIIALEFVPQDFQLRK
jgi:hypothetical protein